MRFSQVSELLQYFIESQKAIAQLYQRIAHQSDAERVRMFLHYLEQRQAEFCGYLARVQQDSPEAILSTWLDFERPDMIEWCQNYDASPHIDAEGVLALNQEVEQRVQQILIKAGETLAQGSAKTLLDNLLEHMRHRQQQLVHTAHRMDDI